MACNSRCWRRVGAAVLNSGVPGVSRVRYSAAAMRWRWKPVFSTSRQVAGVGTRP